MQPGLDIGGTQVAGLVSPSSKRVVQHARIDDERRLMFRSDSRHSHFEFTLDQKAGVAALRCRCKPRGEFIAGLDRHRDTSGWMIDPGDTDDVAADLLHDSPERATRKQRLDRCRHAIQRRAAAWGGDCCAECDHSANRIGSFFDPVR